MLKEVEITGKPGNICAVFRLSDELGVPTRGLAWGPFGDDGKYRLLVDDANQKSVVICEYEPGVANYLEKWWHINTDPQ